jgi:twitching motility protein PilT
LTLGEIMEFAVKNSASDIHITVGAPPIFRINGKLVALNHKKLFPEDTLKMVKEILDDERIEMLKKAGELDFSYCAKGIGNFRINVFRQRGSYGLVARALALKIPTIEKLGLPQIIKDLARKSTGLVLVAGPAGSGKSTTLASMIDLINNERSCHIITLEDPIEYLHEHKKSIVNQREIGHDSMSFSSALRAALRQDPDVILVGEMRDLETISIAITAAETGHLVMSTLHTIRADKTIDRIIDVFPPHQQQQIRTQLSAVLQGVICQNLIVQKDNNGRVAAVEIMLATTAIRNLIREGKSHQIIAAMETGCKYGMQTMDFSLAQLYKQGVISYENALSNCSSEESLLRFIGN